MCLEGTDRGLITRDNCAVVFIDIQPQMIFGVGNFECEHLINNIVMLAKGAKLFDIPIVITTIEAESFSGYCLKELQDIFPDYRPIPRSGMNSWDFEEFRNAVYNAGKKNIIISGLWTEVCVAWPTLTMLDEGFNIFVVDDACGGVDKTTHHAAMHRMIGAGAVPVTAMQMILEFQRDWAHRKTYDGMMSILREHAGAYGVGIEYAHTWGKH